MSVQWGIDSSTGPAAERVAEPPAEEIAEAAAHAEVEAEVDEGQNRPELLAVDIKPRGPADRWMHTLASLCQQYELRAAMDHVLCCVAAAAESKVPAPAQDNSHTFSRRSV